MEMIALICLLGLIAVPVMLIALIVKVSDVQYTLNNVAQRLCRLESDAAKMLAKSESGQGLSRLEGAGAAKPAELPRETAPVKAATASPADAQKKIPSAAEVRKAVETEVRQNVSATMVTVKDRGGTPVDVLFSKIGDWLAVRGQFAPAGMSREFAFATRWLLRVGIVLIVASVAYFLKLSIERGWVGPAQRVAGTVLFGAALSGYGAWLVKKTRYAAIGHALAGIGLVALYLGFGMGHRYFSPPVIESSWVAFGTLFAVTVLGAVMSILLDSPVIAVMSLVGGYLVPAIVSARIDSAFKMDIYLLMLNLGAFFVARRRKWTILDFLSVMAAYITCHAWCCDHGYARNAVIANLAFLCIAHFLYYASVVVSAGIRTKAENELAWGGLFLNAGVHTAWMVHALHGFNRGDKAAGVVLLALASAYLAVAWLSRKRGWADRQCICISVFVGAVYLVIAPMLLLSRLYFAPCWCLVAFACVEAGSFTDMKFLRGVGWVVLAIASMAGVNIAVETYSRVGIAVVMEDGWLLAAGRNLLRIGCVPVALCVLAWRERTLNRGEAKRASVVFAIITSLLYLTGESYMFTNVFLPGLRSGGVTVAWALYAFAVLSVGIARRVKGLRIAGLSLLVAAILKLHMCDIAGLATPWRVGLFALTGVIMILGAFLYIKNSASFADDAGKEK